MLFTSVADACHLCLACRDARWALTISSVRIRFVTYDVGRTVHIGLAYLPIGPYLPAWVIYWACNYMRTWTTLR